MSVRAHADANSSASGEPSRRAHIESTAASRLRVEFQAGLNLRGALDEQRACVGTAQRRQPPHQLACEAERLAAGGNDDDLWAARDECAGDLSDPVEDVLTVVQTQQQAPLRELRSQQRDRSLGGINQHAQRRQPPPARPPPGPRR